MSTKKNVLALYAVQLVSYVLPLITVPYLSHILGPSGLGKIGYAQTVAQILVILVDFGFDLTSTRKIATRRDEPGLVNQVYWTTISAKALLASFGSLVLVGLAMFVYPGTEDRMSILLSMMILWGNVLTPMWLYQGMQRMSTLAIWVVLTRVVMILPLFLFVHSEHDVIVAAGLQFCPAIFSGIVLTVIAFREKLITWRIDTSIEKMAVEAREAYHLFLSSALTSVYMYANVLILRALTGNTQVGFYVAADKIITPLRQLSTPPIQAVFPKICAMYASRQFSEIDTTIRRFLLFFVGTGVAMFVGFELFGDLFIHYFFGKRFHDAFPIMRVLILVPVLIGIAATLVQLRLIASGHQAVLKKIYLVGAIFHICQAPVAIYNWGGVGAACSVVATEALMTLMIALACRKVREACRVDAIATAPGQGVV